MKKAKGHNKMTRPRSKHRSRKGNADFQASRPRPPRLLQPPSNDELPTSPAQGRSVGAPLGLLRARPAAPLQLAHRQQPWPRVPNPPADPLPALRGQTPAQDPKRLSVHSAGPCSRFLPRQQSHALWRCGPGLQPPPSPPGRGRPASRSRRPQGSASQSRPRTSSDSSSRRSPGKSPPPGLTDFPCDQSKRAYGGAR